MCGPMVMSGATVEAPILNRVATTAEEKKEKEEKGWVQWAPEYEVQSREMRAFGQLSDTKGPRQAQRSTEKGEQQQ